jgi:PAS domain S-box-containing protein
MKKTTPPTLQGSPETGESGRQAGQRLRLNEQRMASIYETVGDVIFQLAVEGEGQYRFFSVNPAFSKVTGLPTEAVVGKRVDEVIPEPSLTMVLGMYRQAIEKKTIVRWEEISDYPTGRLIGEVSVGPVFDEQGCCTHLVGSVHDISGHKKIEESLRHNQDFLLALSQASSNVLSARLPEEVYRAVGQEIRSLGYDLMICVPDEDGRRLKIVHTTFAPKLLGMAEKLTGIKMVNFKIPILPENIFGRAMTTTKTEYSRWTAAEAVQLFPKTMHPLVRQIVSLMKVERSIVALLRAEGVTLGILAVTGSELDKRDVPAVEIFAAQVAISLQNAHLAQQLHQELEARRLDGEQIRKRNEDLSLINAILAAGNRGDSLQDILKLTSAQIEGLFNSPGANLHLVNKDRSRMVMQSLYLPDMLRTGIEKIIGMPIPQIEHDLQAAHPYRQVFESGKAQIINGFEGVEEFTTGYLASLNTSEKTRERIKRLVPAIVKLIGRRSIMVTPLLAGHEVIGTLEVASRDTFNEDDLRRLEAIAGQLAFVIQRKQAEQALQASGNELREAQRLAHLGNWKWTVATDTVTWSEELYRINGRDPSLPAPSFAEMPTCYTPESWKRLAEAVGKAMTSGEPYELDLELVRSDGSTRLTISRGETDQDANGKIVGLHGTVLDITERKQAEQARQESEERFRNIFENATVGVFQSIPEGRFLNVNPAMARIYGYDSAEEMLSSVTDIARQIYVDPARRREFTQILKEQGQLFEYSNQNYRKDGSIIWTSTSVRVVKDPDGEMLYYEGFINDITERIQAEEALRKSDAQYRLLANHISDVIWILDLDLGKFTYISPSVESLRGYTVAEVLAQDVAESLAPDSMAVVLNQIPVGIAASKQGFGGPYRHEVEQPCKDGTTVWTETTTHYILNPDSHHWEVYGVSRDISERRQAEQALKLSQARYENLYEQAAVPIMEEDFSQVKLFLDELKAKGVQDFRAYFEKHPQDVQTCSRRVRILDVNLPCVAFFGLKSKAEVIRDLPDYFVEDSWPVFSEEMIQLAEGKLRFESEIPIHMLNGEIRIIWLLLTVVADKQEDLSHVLVSWVDITERKQAEAGVHRWANELESLQKTVLDITAAQSLPGLLEAVVKRACQLVDAPGGGLYLNDPIKQEVRCVVSYQTPVNYSGVVLKYGEGAAGKVAQIGQPLNIQDYPNWPGRSGLFEETQPFSAVLSVPLLWGERVSGVINLLYLETGKSFGSHDVEILTLFAGHAAIAIENSRLLDESLAKQQEVRELSGRLAEAQENERRRIARELHDQVGQSLSALSLNMNIVHLQLPDYMPGVRRRLEDSLMLIDQTTDNIRSLMSELRPAVLDDYGLKAALEWAAGVFIKRYNHKLVVEGECARFSSRVEIALFRIAQEALANVARHAQAQRVSIRLSQVQADFSMTITDNGIGFDLASLPRTEKSGWGLRLMSERADSIGASLEIESAHMQGTKITVRYHDQNPAGR